jgi:hypothetical protein
VTSRLILPDKIVNWTVSTRVKNRLQNEILLRFVRGVNFLMGNINRSTQINTSHKVQESTIMGLTE